MEDILIEFILSSEYNKKLFMKYKNHSDQSAMKELRKDFDYYLKGIKLIAYIKQMINYTVIDYHNKKSRVTKKEILSLNTKDDEFEQEKIDLIKGDDGEFINRIIVPSSDTVDFNSLCLDKSILNAIEKLSYKQKVVLYRAVILNESETELAKELNISRQSVNKTKNKALALIRDELKKVS